MSSRVLRSARLLDQVQGQPNIVKEKANEEMDGEVIPPAVPYCQRVTMEQYQADTEKATEVELRNIYRYYDDNNNLEQRDLLLQTFGAAHPKILEAEEQLKTVSTSSCTVVSMSQFETVGFNYTQEELLKLFQYIDNIADLSKRDQYFKKFQENYPNIVQRFYEDNCYKPAGDQ